jgi:predicted lipoprotein with Yx(FWY)xxD motif
MSRTRPTILAGLALSGLLALSACGSADTPPPPAPAAQSQGMGDMPGMDHPGMSGHAMPGMGADDVALWAVQTGPLGTVVTDATGHVMHRFDKDSASPPTTTCTDACATQWPPVLLPQGRQPELMGVDPAAVGTVTRPDGSRQLTLAGWPLYTNAADDGSLTTSAGEGTDGTWFAVKPDGSKATRP